MKRERKKCVVCGKLGYFHKLASGDSFIEHKKIGLMKRMMGIFLIDAEGCYIKN